MQYLPKPDSSQPSAPAGSVTGDESSQFTSPGLQCQARSALGHQCPRPSDVALDDGGDPVLFCLLHLFAYLTESVETGLRDVVTVTSPEHSS